MRERSRGVFVVCEKDLGDYGLRLWMSRGLGET
jgi:hypothetical protein